MASGPDLVGLPRRRAPVGPPAAVAAAVGRRPPRAEAAAPTTEEAAAAAGWAGAGRSEAEVPDWLLLELPCGTGGSRRSKGSDAGLWSVWARAGRRWSGGEAAGGGRARRAGRADPPSAGRRGEGRGTRGETRGARPAASWCRAGWTPQGGISLYNTI